MGEYSIKTRHDRVLWRTEDPGYVYQMFHKLSFFMFLSSVWGRIIVLDCHTSHSLVFTLPVLGALECSVCYGSGPQHLFATRTSFTLGSIFTDRWLGARAGGVWWFLPELWFATENLFRDSFGLFWLLIIGSFPIFEEVLQTHLFFTHFSMWAKFFYSCDRNRYVSRDQILTVDRRSLMWRLSEKRK